MIDRLLIQLVVSDRFKQRCDDVLTGAFVGVGIFYIVRIWL